MLLILAEAPRPGSELVERLTAFGFDRSWTGRVDKELSKLRTSQLVRSMPDQSGTRTGGRRTYEATEAGRATLATCAADTVELGAVLDNFLSRYRALRPSPPRARPMCPQPVASRPPSRRQKETRR